MFRSSFRVAQKCSIVQVQGFVTARNKLTAVLWILALILSMSFMIIQTGRLFGAFFFANKQTIVRLKSSELPFPAVTFCNLNRFKKKEAEKVPILATLMEVARSVGTEDSSARKKRQSIKGCDEAGYRILQNSCRTFALTNMELSFGLLHVAKMDLAYGRYESQASHPVFALWEFVDAGSTCEFNLKPFASNDALTYSNQNGRAELRLEVMRGGVDQIFFVVETNDGYGGKGYVISPKSNESLSIRLSVDRDAMLSFEHYTAAQQKPGDVWKLIDIKQSVETELQTTGMCHEKKSTKTRIETSTPQKNRFAISSTETSMFERNTLNFTIRDIENMLHFDSDDGYLWKLDSLNDLIPYSISSLSQKKLRSLGYQLSEMLIRCQFGHRACSSRDVELWQDLTSGNCMTFFGGRHAKFVDKAGKENEGLKVVLNVSQETYMDTSLSAGFRFSVNDPDDQILPDADGRLISPGFSIDVILQHKITNRLNWPSGSCEPDSDAKKPKLELCLRYCYQKKIISYCDCADPRYPIPLDFEGEAAYCGIEKRNCLTQIISLLTSQFENDCDCKDRCHSKYYSYTTSVARKLKKWKNSKNSIDVFVYYQSMLHMVYEESAPYKTANLLGDIGGLSGIWLGASFFSVFEILIIIMLLGRC